MTTGKTSGDESADAKVTRILGTADPHGSTGVIERLLLAAGEQRVDALAVVGDIGGGGDYRHLFGALARTSWPVFWVPGPADVPLDRCMQEARDLERGYALVRAHGSVVSAAGGLLFAGFGGEITEDPPGRGPEKRLHFARWEVEYRLGA